MIKHNSSFVLHKTNGKVYIYLQVSYLGQRVRLSTGESIDDETYWDKETQQVKKTYKSKNTTAKLINKTLADDSIIIDEMFLKYDLLRKTPPTPSQIKNDFLKSIGKTTTKTIKETSNDITIHQAIQDFVTAEKDIKQWTAHTLQSIRTFTLSFDKWRKDVTLKELNDTTLSYWAEFLVDKKGLYYRNTTAKLMLRILRWFLRWCNQTGYYHNNLYETFKPKFKTIEGEKEIIFLTKDELQKWMSCKFSPQQTSLEQVRDVFTFACFTGLRHSDVCKLKHTDINNGIIKVVTIKTRDTINININKYAQDILDKYKSYDEAYALPTFSKSYMQKIISQIGEMVNIDTPITIVSYKGKERIETTRPKYKYLTFHSARRTFVVTAMTLGIDTNVIMKFTGHSSVESMKPYMKVVDDLKAKAMDKFNTLFDE